MIHPFNLATAILRLLMDNYREAFREYEPYVPVICVSLQHFYGTWISCWYYMSAIAIIFRCDNSHVSLYKLSPVRFVLVKYSHRGLVNDRYYYNMNMKLFKYLFWISNISAVAVNQGNMWSFSIKHGYSLVTNTYRCSTSALTRTFNDSQVSLNLIID